MSPSARALALVALAGCTNPPTLDVVAEELGDRTLEDAEVPTRFLVAVTGLLAETCGVEEIDQHTFVGGGAAALGVVSLVREEEETDGATETAWVAADAGLDGDAGELRIVADAARSAHVVSWQGESGTLAATLTLALCDPTGATARISGIASWTKDGEARALDAAGPEEAPGLVWAPTDAALPTSGHAAWTRTYGTDGRGDDVSLVLGDAAEIDVDAGVWPGVASGSGWSWAVEVPLP